MSEVIRPKYVMKRVIVCADKHAKHLRTPQGEKTLPRDLQGVEIVALSEFYINDEERRKIREGQVAAIKSTLLQGEHFEAPFVNYRTEKFYRMVDGNHRYEAIAEAAEKDPEIKILVWIAEYKNMTANEVDRLIREKERSIYTVWNKGTKESATDFLKNHFPTIPKGMKMLNQLPVSIYKESTRLPIKLLVGAHVIAKKQTLFDGGYGGNGEKTVTDFRLITDEDIVVMKAFINDYEQIFGPVDTENVWYQSTPLTAFYRIWYDNRTSVPRDLFNKRVQSVFAGNLRIEQQWSMMTKSGGRSACKSFYITAINRLKAELLRGKPISFVSDSDVTGKHRGDLLDADSVDAIEEEA